MCLQDEADAANALQQEEHAANGPKEDKVKIMLADTLEFNTNLVLCSSLHSFRYYLDF